MRAPLIATVLLAAGAASAEPVRLVHTGFLMNAEDQPVTSAALPVTFSIWDDPNATLASHRLWESGACTVSVVRGYYAMELGVGCAAGLDSRLLSPDSARWLEVAVDSSRMTPRLSVVAVPSATLAARALVADALGADVLADVRDASKLTGEAPAAVLGDVVWDVLARGALEVSRENGVVSLSLPTADATHDGALAATDFLAFSGKLDGVAHDGTLAGSGTGNDPLRVDFGAGSGVVRADDARLSDARLPSGSAGGDLSGSYPAPSVAAIQGRAVASASPEKDQVLQWNGSAWTPGTVAAAVGGAGLARRTGAAISTFYVSDALPVAAAVGETTAVLSGDATATLVKNGTDTGARLAICAPGDTLAIRLKSAATYDTHVGASLVYGGSAAAWVVSTTSDTDPDVFDFTDLSGQALNADVTSNTVTLASFTVPLTAAVTGDASAVLVKNGSAVGATTTVNAGDTLAVRLRTSTALGTSKVLSIAVGARTDSWTVTTIAARRSCLAWLQAGATQSTTYLIDPDGTGPIAPFTVYCDQQTDGGGWTLAVGITNTYHHPQTGAVGSITGPGQAARLSDATIAQIKDGSNPAYRLHCGSAVGFWPASCNFSSTADASGGCVQMASSWNGTFVGSSVQGAHVGVADGNRGSADRLIFGRTDLNVCDNPNGWNSNGLGNFWVR